jgi:hypothetical protein
MTDHEHRCAACGRPPHEHPDPLPLPHAGDPLGAPLYAELDARAIADQALAAIDTARQTIAEMISYLIPGSYIPPHRLRAPLRDVADDLLAIEKALRMLRGMPR